MTAAWLKPPDDDDPKWYVKRWMAVTCIKVMILSVIWILCLLTYAVISGKEAPGLNNFATILALFAPCLASIPIKYYHDESKADLAKIHSKEL